MGRTQVNKRSTYARPGTHVQQCSALLKYICVLHHLTICALGRPLMCSCGCRGLSTTTAGLHLNYSSTHLTLHRAGTQGHMGKGAGSRQVGQVRVADERCGRDL